MKTSNIARVCYLLSIFYFLFTVFIYYNEKLNSFFFVLSFFIMVIGIIKTLLNQGTLSLFKYTFSRIQHHLSQRNENKNAKDLVSFYEEHTSKQSKLNSIFVISVLIFVETIIIAFIHQ